MNKLCAIGAIILLSVSVSSCDMFRRMVGRPTSAQIAEMKELKEAARAFRQADSLRILSALDSLASSEASAAAAEDSLEVVRCLEAENVKVSGSRLVSATTKENLSRYYVIVGSFGNPKNADAVSSQALEKGYPSELIPYTNGLVAVGLCPSGTLLEIYESLKRLRTESFCPAEAWILDNGQ